MPPDGAVDATSVAIDGSKFKAVNTRDKNFTRNKVERRRAQLEKSVARYLAQLDTADRQEPSEELAAKTVHLKEKLVKLGSEMQRLAAMERLMLASPDQQICSLTPTTVDGDERARLRVVGYNVQVDVDTEHHLIVADGYEWRLGSGATRRYCLPGRGGPASTNSRLLPIEATTAARKSSPVTRPKSQ